MTFEDWMVSVYQGQHSFKNPEQALRSAWDAGAAAERDKYEAKFKQLEALMQVREQQPNKPCCLAEREACAKLAETEGSNPYATRHAAAAIRARKENT